VGTIAQPFETRSSESLRSLKALACCDITNIYNTLRFLLLKHNSENRNSDIVNLLADLRHLIIDIRPFLCQFRDENKKGSFKQVDRAGGSVTIFEVHPDVRLFSSRFPHCKPLTFLMRFSFLGSLHRKLHLRQALKSC